MKTGFQFLVSIEMAHCLGVDRKSFAAALELAAAQAAKQYILGTKASVTVVEDGAQPDGVANLEPPGSSAKRKLPAGLVLNMTSPGRVALN